MLHVSSDILYQKSSCPIVLEKSKTKFKFHRVTRQRQSLFGIIMVRGRSDFDSDNYFSRKRKQRESHPSPSIASTYHGARVVMNMHEPEITSAVARQPS